MTESASPATMAYLGRSAADVCAQLALYSSETRVLHAIDALVTAIVYNRKDTIEVLTTLNTPLDQRGLLDVSPAEVMRELSGD